MQLKQLVDVLNELLKPKLFKDYCPNGLQVQGRAEVRSIVAGVTASKALVQAAVDQGADALLVHHGYFWRGEPAEVVGIKAERIKLLLKNDISLIAYHLPLDAHPSLGNNAQLGSLLGFQDAVGMDRPIETSIGMVGNTKHPQSLEAISGVIADRLGRKPLVIKASGHAQPIHRVAWCTGAAQNRIQDAAELGCDLYISGEVSEQTYHLAQELGIHYIAAGHHATERYGAKAVSEWLHTYHGIEQTFVDIDNPV